jgi:hypothetical protein
LEKREKLRGIFTTIMGEIKENLEKGQTALMKSRLKLKEI